jgi:hypothetical protein
MTLLLLLIMGCDDSLKLSPEAIAAGASANEAQLWTKDGNQIALSDEGQTVAIGSSEVTNDSKLVVAGAATFSGGLLDTPGTWQLHDEIPWPAASAPYKFQFTGLEPGQQYMLQINGWAHAGGIANPVNLTFNDEQAGNYQYRDMDNAFHTGENAIRLVHGLSSWWRFDSYIYISMSLNQAAIKNIHLPKRHNQVWADNGRYHGTSGNVHSVELTFINNLEGNRPGFVRLWRFVDPTD